MRSVQSEFVLSFCVSSRFSKDRPTSSLIPALSARLGIHDSLSREAVGKDTGKDSHTVVQNKDWDALWIFGAGMMTIRGSASPLSNIISFMCCATRKR